MKKNFIMNFIMRLCPLDCGVRKIYIKKNKKLRIRIRVWINHFNIIQWICSKRGFLSSGQIIVSLSVVTLDLEKFSPTKIYTFVNDSRLLIHNRKWRFEFVLEHF